MKRIIPFFAAALVVSISADAFARSRRIQRVERINGDRAVIVTETARTPALAPIAEREIVVGTGREIVEERAMVGVDARGVARSSGVGIGEASTRSYVGTGRGGAGIVRSGTLAPSAVDVGAGGTAGTAVPAEIVRTTDGRLILRPIIPRETTFSGTLGAGTSTPVGIAPGY
jgi:hypothetical protein